MKVCVTSEQIQNGVERDSQRCMIADAIKACRPKAQFIQVDLQTIRFTDPEKRTRYFYLTPPIAQHNLLKFDQGKPVTPFEFALNTPARTRAMQSDVAKTEKRQRQVRKARKKYKANQKKYAYLAANRARNHQREREFGLRKFVA